MKIKNVIPQVDECALYKSIYNQYQALETCNVESCLHPALSLFSKLFRSGRKLLYIRIFNELHFQKAVGTKRISYTYK